MNRLVLFVLLVLMAMPVMAQAPAKETTHILDLDEASVIGEIEDPFIFDVFRKSNTLIEGIQDLNKSFIDEIKVIDKEAFELDIKR
jgi:hypothetical protein